MTKKITIAIDGWSSCGKSTLAKSLAKQLNYIYVDSGAMYRGVTLYALHHKMVEGESVNKDKLIQSLTSIHLLFSNHNSNQYNLYLNSENVEEKIRSMSVSNVVSQVATIKEVRTFLVNQQREIGKNGGVVMDGRDIGSVVFPNAEVKFFLTASQEIRAKRRFDELNNKGVKITLEEVRQNIKLRDTTDANRTESPLIQTDDAIVIDNSFMTPEEQLAKAMGYVKKQL